MTRVLVTGMISKGEGLNHMRRSLGQVIALSRLVLASVFLLAIYIDPSQPIAAPATAYLILALYVAAALALLLVTWHNWWLDHRLARPSHILDLGIFAVVVFSTEGYTSPFFTFSLFLLLSAAMRWGGRETALTAIAVNVLFLLSGFASALAMPGDIDLQRVLIRSSYLIVLSLLFITYAVGKRDDGRPVLQARVRGSSHLRRVIELIVEHVAGRLGSGQVIAVWREENTDRHGSAMPHACRLGEAGHVFLNIPNDVLKQVLSDSASQPFLFDAEKGRMLLARPDRVAAARISQQLAQFLERRDLAAGLAVPFGWEGLNGVIFAAAEVSVDDLQLGTRLMEEAAFMLEQGLLNRLSEETAEARTRLALARDLHDSVAQLLAGLSFRLEALKRSGKAAPELRDDVELLQQELATEQDHVRALIAELRHRAQPPEDIVQQMRILTDRLARQWSIKCTFACSGDMPPSSVRLVGKDIEQMVREGVANAVRHGKADRVDIGLKGQLDSLELTIADNGCGLPKNGDGATRVRPRSLEERAQALGGELEALSGESGTTIRIRLPLEVHG